MTTDGKPEYEIHHDGDRVPKWGVCGYYGPQPIRETDLPAEILFCPDAPQPATTDDTVERAARATWEQEWQHSRRHDWDAQPDDVKAPFRADARAALAAQRDREAVDREALAWKEAISAYPTEHVGYDRPVPATCRCDECYRREDQRNAYVAGRLAARGDAASWSRCRARDLDTDHEAGPTRRGESTQRDDASGEPPVQPVIEQHPPQGDDLGGTHEDRDGDREDVHRHLRLARTARSQQALRAGDEHEHEDRDDGRDHATGVRIDDRHGATVAAGDQFLARVYADALVRYGATVAAMAAAATDGSADEHALAALRVSAAWQTGVEPARRAWQATVPVDYSTSPQE